MADTENPGEDLKALTAKLRESGQIATNFRDGHIRWYARQRITRLGYKMLPLKATTAEDAAREFMKLRISGKL